MPAMRPPVKRMRFWRTNRFRWISARRRPRSRREPVCTSVAFYSPPDSDNSIRMPDQAKPIVSALVVSHNAKDQLLQSLHAFFASADVPVEAIVVDNASTDGSAAAVTDEFPQA